MFKRENTKRIKIGNIEIGGSDEIKIQSMCNVKTDNIEDVVKQILELEDAGVDIMRVSVPDEKAALSIDKIKNKIHIPLVADIHFDYKLALMCIERGIDKIRINPGNIKDFEKIKCIANECNKKNIPIRIGVNSGSVDKEILKKYDGRVTVSALLDMVKINVDLLNKCDFDNIVLSLKSSNVTMAVEAYKKISEIYNYPLHIGITEAGTLYSGSVKSSVGLGILLYEGLGDTMRVSLTANPIEEVKLAKEILKSLNLLKSGIEVISCPTCGRTNINIIEIANEVEERVKELKTKKYIKIAVMGCIVNGPGEAREANVGVAGGNGEGLIFKKGEIIKKIREEEIVNALIDEVKKMI